MTVRTAGFLVFTCLTLAAPAIAQTRTDCGKVPQFESKSEEQEKVIRELNAKAQFLSKLVASLGGGGAFDTERKTIYKNSPNSEAARRDAYLMYMVCMIIMDDPKLTGADKLRALTEFLNPPEGTSSFKTQIDQLSVLADEANAIQNIYWQRIMLT
jgi:hypothetical protein